MAKCILQSTYGDPLDTGAHFPEGLHSAGRWLQSAVEESLRLFATAASPSRGYLTRWSAVSS